MSPRGSSAARLSFWPTLFSSEPHGTDIWVLVLWTLVLWILFKTSHRGFEEPSKSRSDRFSMKWLLHALPDTASLLPTLATLHSSRRPSRGCDCRSLYLALWAMYTLSMPSNFIQLLTTVTFSTLQYKKGRRYPLLTSAPHHCKLSKSHPYLKNFSDNGFPAFQHR